MDIAGMQGGLPRARRILFADCTPTVMSRGYSRAAWGVVMRDIRVLPHVHHDSPREDKSPWRVGKMDGDKVDLRCFTQQPLSRRRCQKVGLDAQNLVRARVNPRQALKQQRGDPRASVEIRDV